MMRQIVSANLGIALSLLLLCPCWLNCQRHDPDARTIFEAGQRALSRGDAIEAQHDFEHLLQIGIRNAPVRINLGVAYLRIGKFDKAIAELTEAKKLAPDVTGIDLNLGLAYYRKRDFVSAVPYFEAILKTNPQNEQAHYLAGECRFLMDDFAAAVSLLGPIEHAERDDLEYLFMLGVSYGKLKRPDDLARVIAKLMAAGGDTAHLHLLLGKAHLALGHEQQAQVELEKACTSATCLPYTHYYLGTLFRSQGKIEKAAAELTAEIAVSPSEPWAYEELAKIRLAEGKPASAIPVLENAVEHNPDSAALRSILGKAYIEASAPSQAIPQLKRAIALDPVNGSYHYQLGRAYLKSGKGLQAKQEMEIARRLQVDVHQGQMEELSRDRQAR